MAVPPTSPVFLQGLSGPKGSVGVGELNGRTATQPLQGHARERTNERVSPPVRSIRSLRARRFLLRKVLPGSVRCVVRDDPGSILRFGRAGEVLAKVAAKRLRIDADLKSERLRGDRACVRHSFDPFVSGKRFAFPCDLSMNDRSFARVRTIYSSLQIVRSFNRSFVRSLCCSSTAPLPPPRRAH